MKRGQFNRTYHMYRRVPTRRVAGSHSTQTSKFFDILGSEILSAITTNNIERLRLIVDGYLPSPQDISRLCTVRGTRSRDGRTAEPPACPLLAAIELPDTAILNYLLDVCSFDANHTHSVSAGKKSRTLFTTPLTASVQCGLIDVVEMLLDAGADPNVTDGEGHSPLWIAVAGARCDIARLLVLRGADRTSLDLDTGETPLHAAAALGHSQLARTLIDDRRQTAANQLENRLSPLRVLSKSGAMPIHVAAAAGHVHLVQLFCSIDPSVVDTRTLRRPPENNDGGIGEKEESVADKTPLHSAAERGHVETVLALVELFSADLGATDAAGNTALHLVVSRRHRPGFDRPPEFYEVTAQTLIKYGLDFKKRNDSKETPRDLALKNGWIKIAEMLGFLESTASKECNRRTSDTDNRGPTGGNPITNDKNQNKEVEHNIPPSSLSSNNTQSYNGDQPLSVLPDATSLPASDTEIKAGLVIDSVTCKKATSVEPEVADDLDYWPPPPPTVTAALPSGDHTSSKMEGPMNKLPMYSVKKDVGTASCEQIPRLNIKVTGEVPKAYNRQEREAARTAFILSQPVGLECRETNEHNRIHNGTLYGAARFPEKNNNQSPPSINPVRKEISHVTPPKAAADSVANGTHRPVGLSTLLIMQPTPYRSFGKINPKVDAIEEALKDVERKEHDDDYAALSNDKDDCLLMQADIDEDWNEEDDDDVGKVALQSENAKTETCQFSQTTELLPGPISEVKPDQQQDMLSGIDAKISNKFPVSTTTVMNSRLKEIQKATFEELSSEDDNQEEEDEESYLDQGFTEDLLGGKSEKFKAPRDKFDELKMVTNMPELPQAEDEQSSKNDNTKGLVENDETIKSPNNSILELNATQNNLLPQKVKPKNTTSFLNPVGMLRPISPLLVEDEPVGIFEQVANKNELTEDLSDKQIQLERNSISEPVYQNLRDDAIGSNKDKVDLIIAESVTSIEVVVRHSKNSLSRRNNSVDVETAACTPTFNEPLSLLSDEPNLAVNNLAKQHKRKPLKSEIEEPKPDRKYDDPNQTQDVDLESQTVEDGVKNGKKKGKRKFMTLPSVNQVEQEVNQEVGHEIEAEVEEPILSSPHEYIHPSNAVQHEEDSETFKPKIKPHKKKGKSLDIELTLLNEQQDIDNQLVPEPNITFATSESKNTTKVRRKLRSGSSSRSPQNNELMVTSFQQLDSNDNPDGDESSEHHEPLDDLQNITNVNCGRSSRTSKKVKKIVPDTSEQFPLNLATENTRNAFQKKTTVRKEQGLLTRPEPDTPVEELDDLESKHHPTSPIHAEHDNRSSVRRKHEKLPRGRFVGEPENVVHELFTEDQVFQAENLSVGIDTIFPSAELDKKRTVRKKNPSGSNSRYGVEYDGPPPYIECYTTELVSDETLTHNDDGTQLGLAKKTGRMSVRKKKQQQLEQNSVDVVDISAIDVSHQLSLETPQPPHSQDASPSSGVGEEVMKKPPMSKRSARPRSSNSSYGQRHDEAIPYEVERLQSTIVDSKERAEVQRYAQSFNPESIVDTTITADNVKNADQLPHSSAKSIPVVEVPIEGAQLKRQGKRMIRSRSSSRTRTEQPALRNIENGVVDSIVRDERLAEPSAAPALEGSDIGSKPRKRMVRSRSGSRCRQEPLQIVEIEQLADDFTNLADTKQTKNIIVFESADDDVEAEGEARRRKLKKKHPSVPLQEPRQLVEIDDDSTYLVDHYGSEIFVQDAAENDEAPEDRSRRRKSKKKHILESPQELVPLLEFEQTTKNNSNISDVNYANTADNDVVVKGEARRRQLKKKNASVSSQGPPQFIEIEDTVDESIDLVNDNYEHNTHEEDAADDDLGAERGLKSSRSKKKHSSVSPQKPLQFIEVKQTTDDNADSVIINYINTIIVNKSSDDDVVAEGGAKRQKSNKKQVSESRQKPLQLVDIEKAAADDVDLVDVNYTNSVVQESGEELLEAEAGAKRRKSKKKPASELRQEPMQLVDIEQAAADDMNLVDVNYTNKTVVHESGEELLEAEAGTKRRKSKKKPASELRQEPMQLVDIEQAAADDVDLVDVIYTNNTVVQESGEEFVEAEAGAKRRKSKKKPASELRQEPMQLVDIEKAAADDVDLVDVNYTKNTVVQESGEEFVESEAGAKRRKSKKKPASELRQEPMQLVDIEQAAADDVVLVDVNYTNNTVVQESGEEFVEAEAGAKRRKSRKKPAFELRQEPMQLVDIEQAAADDVDLVDVNYTKITVVQESGEEFVETEVGAKRRKSKKKPASGLRQESLPFVETEQPADDGVDLIASNYVSMQESADDDLEREGGAKRFRLKKKQPSECLPSTNEQEVVSVQQQHERDVTTPMFVASQAVYDSSETKRERRRKHPLVNETYEADVPEFEAAELTTAGIPDTFCDQTQTHLDGSHVRKNKKKENVTITNDEIVKLELENAAETAEVDGQHLERVSKRSGRIRKGRSKLNCNNNNLSRDTSGDELAGDLLLTTLSQTESEQPNLHNHSHTIVFTAENKITNDMDDIPSKSKTQKVREKQTDPEIGLDVCNAQEENETDSVLKNKLENPRSIHLNLKNFHPMQADLGNDSPTEDAVVDVFGAKVSSRIEAPEVNFRARQVQQVAASDRPNLPRSNTRTTTGPLSPPINASKPRKSRLKVRNSAMHKINRSLSYMETSFDEFEPVLTSETNEQAIAVNESQKESSRRRIKQIARGGHHSFDDIIGDPIRGICPIFQPIKNNSSTPRDDIPEPFAPHLVTRETAFVKIEQPLEMHTTEDQVIVSETEEQINNSVVFTQLLIQAETEPAETPVVLISKLPTSVSVSNNKDSDSDGCPEPIFQRRQSDKTRISRSAVQRKSSEVDAASTGAENKPKDNSQSDSTCYSSSNEEAQSTREVVVRNPTSTPGSAFRPVNRSSLSFEAVPHAIGHMSPVAASSTMIADVFFPDEIVTSSPIAPKGLPSITTASEEKSSLPADRGLENAALTISNVQRRSRPAERAGSGLSARSMSLGDAVSQSKRSSGGDTVSVPNRMSSSKAAIKSSLSNRRRQSRQAKGAVVAAREQREALQLRPLEVKQPEMSLQDAAFEMLSYGNNWDVPSSTNSNGKAPKSSHEVNNNDDGFVYTRGVYRPVQSASGAVRRPSGKSSSIWASGPVIPSSRRSPSPTDVVPSADPPPASDPTTRESGPVQVNRRRITRLRSYETPETSQSTVI